MIILFVVLLLGASLLCLPAFLISRRRGAESGWLLFVTLPALVVWIGLTYLGYGAQSMSNLIEVILLFPVGVILCYLKVFVLDRRMRRPGATTYALMSILAAGAFLLRTFMPVLPGGD